MFKGLQAASARFNLRSTMNRLNEKIGAGSGKALDSKTAGLDIDLMKGLFIDLRFLIDNWNPEVKDLPPEKVIRDFNLFLFSGKYDLFVTHTLAITVSYLDEKRLGIFTSILNYYFSTYGQKDCKERKLIQIFVSSIFDGFNNQRNEGGADKKFINEFESAQTSFWELDKESTIKEIAKSLDDALNRRKEISDVNEDVNSDFNSLSNLAFDQLKKNDNEAAINTILKAIKLAPNKIEIVNCYTGLGIAKYQLNDFDGSIDAFTNAIQLEEDPSSTYLRRANAKYEAKDFSGAIADYDKALENYPTKYPEAYYNRANAKMFLNYKKGAIEDLNKSADLGSQSARDLLKTIQSDLEKTKVNNIDNLKNKSIDNKYSKKNEKKPIRRDAIQNVLETKLDNFNPTFKTWATFKALKRLAWVMEDDESDDKEFYPFLLQRYEAVSSSEKFKEWIKELLYDKTYDNDDPEWLESDWNIGPNSDLHAFNSKESFLKSFDSEYTYSIFSKCWEIACSEDLYKLNDYESWSKKKYWFFKNKIWIITAEQVNKYYLKNDVLNKFLDSSQLESFFNYKIGNGISVLEISGVKEVGEKLNYMNKTDLIKFHELPVELLENLATRPISKEDSELEFDYVEGNDTLGILPGGYYWIGDPINIQGNFRNKLNDSSNGGCFYSKNGMPFAFFETALGDGVFEDQKSNQYLVDSGQIACIPMEKIPEELDELGHIFHITNPFVCQYIDNGGFICFGEIVIKTDITNECSFPEPLKIEELGALNYGKYLYENDCGKADTWSKWASTIANEKIEDQSFKAAVEIYAKVKKSEISSESAFNLIVDKYGEKCSSGSFMAIYSSLDNQSKSKEIDLSDAVSTQKDLVMEFLNKHYSKEYIQEIINDKNKTNEEIEEYLFAIWLERNNSLVKKLSAWVEHKIFVHKNS